MQMSSPTGSDFELRILDCKMEVVSWLAGLPDRVRSDFNFPSDR